MEEQRLWALWFRGLLDPVEAIFPRATRPPGAKGRPRLAGFCDASMVATCVAVYVVWEMSDKISSRLLMGKCRVAPLLGTTIPRGELQSLTILHRVLLVVVEASPYRFLSVSAFTDSLCSLGALSKPGSAMRPFFTNRVSEILRLRLQLQELTDCLVPVQHVKGTDNPADVGTRGQVGLQDLGPNSIWQGGPDFLTAPFLRLAFLGRQCPPLRPGARDRMQEACPTAATLRSCRCQSSHLASSAV